MKLYQMRCALYVRRSTEEHQMASLEVQRDEGSRYATRQGGTISSEHVFIDDAVSRAEFKKRPGLIALLNAARAGQFDVVIVRDESRLGGDTFRSGLVIQDILESGVRLFYYYGDEEVALDGAVDKFMIAARSFAAELEREKTSQRTHEHLLTKARRGLVVGGRVYGYDNVEIKEGDRRVGVEYRINEKEADIVREIFRRYTEGDGLRTIVKDLNVRQIPPPRAGKRGTGSWSTSAIWSMLRRERYRGILVWNTREKTYRGGTKVRIPRDPSGWIRAEAPHLRIVTDELWFAVQAHAQRSQRSESQNRAGRPPRHLLSGFARCAECGGPITVTNGKQSYETIKVYGCAYSRDRGKTVCSNTLRRPMEAINSAVIGWISANMLSEETLGDTLRIVKARMAETAASTASEVPQLEKDAARLKVEIDRLVLALATTDKPLEAVVSAIADRQEQLSTLEARLRAAKAAPEAIRLEVGHIEREARERLRSLKTLLERNPDEARLVIGALFEKPITFSPVDTDEGRRFKLEGSAGFVNLLTIQDGCLNSASPTGFEPV